MPGHRVMIIDDNHMNLELVSYMLEAANFAVKVEVDAVTALKSIPDFKPQLILMDIQLPGMDGLELTRLLKGDPLTNHIAIVAFTAYAMKGDEAKMLGAGCDGYISKPINVSTFISQIRAYLVD
ncbi:response regulator [Aquabacterium sp. CECT 9606]|uniref:response regulator n=1 Tax=Aquabacterium sp. CECT 9606 TaxID=2845822 RepID=UPI001E55E2D4|nr:response regulator [Aquabacterium sp. CECT 9606]CAH0352797.1 Polar-differentiation response regulator DivK [Aquabacterium sp. CECT 9606]